MESTNNNFSFFSKVKLSKGDDEKSTKMIVSGIASTGSKDADGEFLDPKGFELDYFLDKGFINWNHGKSPLERVIGKPLIKGTEIKDGNMVLTCELFPQSELAKEVYQLGEILEAQGLSLGYSIEGEVIERDPMDSRKVTKAKITACAITPNPKNEDAIAELAKGHGFNELINKNNNTVEFNYQKLIDANPNLTGEQLNAISKIMNTNTNDEVSKALAVLGLNAAPVETLEKGMDYDSMSDSDMEKAYEEMGKRMAMKKAMKEKADMEKGDKDKTDEKVGMSKGVDVSGLETLIKGHFSELSTKNESRDVLVKSLLSGLKTSNEKADNLEKSLASLTERLTKIENTPNPQKSVVGTANVIEKGYDAVPNAGAETNKVLGSYSKNSNRREIIALMDNVLTLRKGHDADILNNEVNSFESTGHVGAQMRKELEGLKIEITE